MEQWNSVKNPPETKVSHKDNCVRERERERKRERVERVGEREKYTQRNPFRDSLV